jgi:hypothetical protein
MEIGETAKPEVQNPRREEGDSLVEARSKKPSNKYNNEKSVCKPCVTLA